MSRNYTCSIGAFAFIEQGSLLTCETRARARMSVCMATSSSIPRGDTLSVKESPIEPSK